MGERVARIAFLAPLTGDEAVVGVPMMQAVELAVEEANAASKLPFRVELLAMDDRAEPETARGLAKGLVQDSEVVGVVGHKNSGPSNAAGAVYASAGLAQITQSSTNSDLARQGWQTFFRVCADNDRQATTAARYALDVLNVHRVAIVHRLGDAECDLIYFGLTEIESSFLIRGLRGAGVTTHCFGADGGRQSPFPQLAGQAAEGCYETYAGVDPQTSAQAQVFVRAFESHYGSCPIFGPEAYDAACIFLEALRRVGVPDRSAVLAEIKALDGFVGATGAISFEPNGNRRDAGVTIWQVIDGQMTLLV
jgi:branched-chain amino acid transport system substrate-binding protein